MNTYEEFTIQINNNHENENRIDRRWMRKKKVKEINVIELR